MNEQADRKLDDLHGKALAEAAQTYALGVLGVDVADDLDDLWQASFANEEERREAEAALDGLDDRDRELLMSVAMRATAEDRPDTEKLLAASVEQADESLVVFEIAALTIAASLLLREWHKKGRKSETRKKTVIEPGRVTIEESEVEFEPSDGLAKVLAKLGLGAAT
jgi:hypothetical protein